MENALAPLRPAVLEAPGWYFGDGDLAMPVASLLKWDLSLINQSLLAPASYKQMETPFTLKDGTATSYGLGVHIESRDGRRILEHSGEVGGFVAENMVYPEDRAAIAVLTNDEASGAAAQIAHAIAAMLFGSAAPDGSSDSFAPTLKTILAGLQKGTLDRTLFTADCNAYFDADALGDFASSLAPLGKIVTVTRSHTALRGGMTFAAYRVAFSGGTAIEVTLYIEPDGKIEQLLVVGKG
jgi:hypothetical protein